MASETRTPAAEMAPAAPVVRTDVLPSKTERLIRSVRTSPLFRQLVPMEAGTGWPIPVRKQDAGQGFTLYVTLPFYGQFPNPAERKTVLYPPLATITVGWADQRPVEYVNLRYRNPWPEGTWDAEAGTFPHAAIADLTRDEYQALRTELLGMYDSMFDALAQGAPIDDAWSARFGELLRTLMDPGLEPYYRALAPKFFERFLGPAKQ